MMGDVVGEDQCGTDAQERSRGEMGYGECRKATPLTAMEHWREEGSKGYGSDN